MPLYDEDLAYVQATAYGEFAAGAMPAVVNHLRSAGLGTGRIVDIGCGAGVSTRALADAGFRPIGIDVSPYLLSVARNAVPTAEFHLASAYQFQIPPCAAILALGEPLTYHAPDVDPEALLQTFLQRAADALEPGGQLVFDVISAEGPPLDARQWKSGEDWAVLSETAEDRMARRLVRTIETFRRIDDRYRCAREVHHVKLFGEQEIGAWLTRAGFDFKTADSYGAHHLGPRRMAFFATRQ